MRTRRVLLFVLLVPISFYSFSAQFLHPNLAHALQPTVTVTGVAANNSSVKIHYNPVPGAKDYRVYDTALPTAVKYAGLVHLTGAPACPNASCDVPSTQIEWSNVQDGHPHTLVVQAVDQLGPVPPGNLYDSNSVPLHPGSCCLGLNAGQTPDGMRSTNGQGPYTNNPQVIATSQPFVVQANPSLLPIPSTGSATQTYLDTFNDSENSTIVQTAKDDTAESMTYSMNANTRLASTIQYHFADTKNSFPFVSGGHFMDVLFDGGTPGTNVPLHQGYGSASFVPNQAVTLASGQILHLTMEVDGHLSNRRWMSFALAPANDPLTGLEPGHDFNRANHAVLMQLFPGGCTLDVFNGDNNGTSYWGALGQAPNDCYSGQRSQQFSDNGIALDTRSRFDLFLTANHAALFENGQLVIESAISIPWLTAGAFQTYFTHYVYHTDNDVSELLNGDCYPMNSYWFNDPVSGSSACGNTYPAGYGFSYSDERHWDNLGFEVVPVGNPNDFSGLASLITMPPILPPNSDPPPPTPTPGPTNTPTNTPTATTTPTPTILPTATSTAATGPTPTNAPVAPTSTPAPVLGSRVKTVFMIVLENHDWSSFYGNTSSAPYINNTLLPTASYATQYYNPPGNHPSLPNYLWLEGGQCYSYCGTDNNPGAPITGTHLTTLLDAAGISWGAYQENITSGQCPTQDNYPYAVRHNPFVYFNNVSGSNSYCTAHEHNYADLAARLAANTVPRYTFITPNLCNDGHDSCDPLNDPIKQTDTWLQNNVPQILNSQAYKNGGALFITWDEGESGDGPIGMMVLSPFAKGHGYSNAISYTHSSTLRTVEEIFGVSPMLGDAAHATDLSDLFTGTPTPTPTPTSTAVPPTPTPTSTQGSPTPTATTVPPTATSTATKVPPTATPTRTMIPPTATPTVTPSGSLMIADFENSTNGFVGNSDITSMSPSTYAPAVAHGSYALWTKYSIPTSWSEAQLFKTVNLNLGSYSTLSVSVYPKRPTGLTRTGVKVRFLVQGSDNSWYSSLYQSVPLDTRTTVRWSMGGVPRSPLKQLYVCWQFTTSATSTGSQMWMDDIQAF